ncbi:MAG: SGNH/GDSL hydrolase family protein [Acidimicrobiales bacterium]
MTTDQLEADLGRVLGEAADRVEPRGDLLPGVTARLGARRRRRRRERMGASVAVVFAVVLAAVVALGAAGREDRVVVAPPPGPGSTTTDAAASDPRRPLAEHPRVAIFGDAGALMAGLGFSRWAESSGAITVVPGDTRMGCGLVLAAARADPHGGSSSAVPDECRDLPAAWARALDAATPDVAVVLIGENDLDDLQLSSDVPVWQSVGSPEVDVALQRRMLEVTDAITSRGATAVWLTLPSIAAVPGVDRGPAGDPARAARYREVVAQLPARRPGAPVAVVDLAGWLATAGDPSLRPDGVHLTNATATAVVERWLGPAVLDAYRRAAAAGGGSSSTAVPTSSIPTGAPADSIPDDARPDWTPGPPGSWVPYGGDDALHPGVVVPQAQGWAHSGDPASTPGRTPIYDRPDGSVVGYAYSQLGFVPLAEDPTFDAHAERVRRFGCDAFADPSCHPRGLGRPAGS